MSWQATLESQRRTSRREARMPGAKPNPPVTDNSVVHHYYKQGRRPG